jgi:NAD-dependent SIR2 family protein deacetylase
MWQELPILKRQGIRFDDMVREDMFQFSPSKFWYFWGSLYNRMRDLEPHEGHHLLLDMLLRVKGANDWFVYHEGVDLLYERANYPIDAIMQGKGNLFYWQCKPCNTILRVASK